MFKFSLPMKILLSSGSCLMLLTMACFLLVMSNTVYTSDISGSETPTAVAIERSEVASDESPPPPSTPSSESATSATLKAATHTGKLIADGRPDSRRRNGRLYGSSRASEEGSSRHQSSALDSYAAAYAAANSAGPSLSSSSSLSSEQQASAHPIVQSSIQDAYSSFGELPPTSNSAQAKGSGEFVSPHSNYYANHVSPSSNEASYSSSNSHLVTGSAGSVHHHAGSHFSPHHYKSQQVPMGYPTSSVAYDRYPSFVPSYYDRTPAASSSPFWGSPSFLNFGGGGLMSSASHALSHWTSALSISEIICGLVALAIGAVILGAPFFLIYLALMGNFSGSGTLSLTNPTTASGAAAGGVSTTVNGRRKRFAIFETINSDNPAKTGRQDSRDGEYIALADAIVSKLSPFINLQQVSMSFKHLADGLDKYSHIGAERRNSNRHHNHKASGSANKILIQ